MIPAKPAGTLRLMSWNVHGGIGPDRRFDLGRIVALVSRHAPDILALQELDTRGREADCLLPLRTAVAEEGHFAEARTIVAADGHYGHALFSRWAMSAVAIHDLSQKRREPRSAIEATIATAAGPLHVVAVHLGLAIAERWRQARFLANLAETSPSMPTAMLGDFNDWFPIGSVRTALAARLPARTRLRTFPAARPLLRLDRIYLSVPCTLVADWTDPAARWCSDHLPIIADIRMQAT